MEAHDNESKPPWNSARLNINVTVNMTVQNEVIIGQVTKGAKRTKGAKGSDTVFWGNNYRLPRVAYRPLYRYVSDGMGMIQGRTTVVTWGKRITS